MKRKFALVRPRASRRFLLSSIFTGTIVVTMAPIAGTAADLYWDRTAGTNTWGTNTNWSTDASLNLEPVAAPGIADLAIFNSTTLTTAQQIDLAAAHSALGLLSNSDATVTLLGSGGNRVLTLAGSGITKAGTGALTIGSATANIQVSLALSADQIWANNNNTGAITIVNGVASSTAVNRVLTLGGSSTALNTVSGVIANNGVGVLTLNKANAGTWVLAGANTYTGVTTISGGILTVQNNAALGTNAGGTVIQSGATLNLGGTLAAGLNLGTEAITVSGAGAGGIGAITNIGTNDHQNAIQGVVTMVGDTTFGGSRRWDIRNNTLNGGGAGYVLTKVGSNSVFLSGTSQIGTSLGQLLVKEGELVMETGATALTGNITAGVMIAPTTAVTGSFRSWSNFVDQTANFTLDSSLIAGAVARLAVDNGYTTHSGTITATGGDNRLDVTGSAVMIDTGVLAGTGTFRKEGGGVLLVNGTSNTHSGAFNLNGGFLGGTGTLTSSALNINNGGTLSPGLLNQAGTFNVTNAVVSSGTNTALFNLGTTSDLVNVGTLTQNGTTNIAVIPGAGFGPGTYTLFDYGAPLGGTTGFAGFRLNHVDATLIDTGSEIKLQVNSTTVPTWSGVSNGIWTAGSLTNPILPNFAFAPAPGGQVEFATHDAVLFDDSAAGTTNITLSGAVAPAVTRFNNTTKAYVLTGGISGSGAIIKDGGGTAALLSTPSNLGGLIINSGTLQLGNDNNTAGYQSGQINIATGATLAVMAGNGAATANLGLAGGGATPISGGGTILLNNTSQDIYHNFAADRGNVSIIGDMTGFTGNIIINDGNRLTAPNPYSLGNAAGITINNGAGLYVSSATLNYAGPITASGLGWQETTGYLGAIRLQNGTLSGPINLTGDTRITGWSGTTGTLSGVISGSAGTDVEFGLVFAGAAGTLNVTNPANSYGGNTSVNRMTINAATIANSGISSSLGAGSVINMEVGNLVITGSGAMTSNRAINLNQNGQGGSTIGVTTPGAVVTLTGAITNGNANFPISTLDFRQTISPDGTTGGTIVLDTATPIYTSGTNIHRTNLTLAGNTNFTVGFATTGTTAAPLGLPGDFKVGFNTTAANSGAITLTVQDNATLTTYGRFDVANENPGVAVTTTVNQTGGVVNAMRGGASLWAAAGNESNNAMRIGHWTTSLGIYNLSGGTLNVPNGYVNLGHDGSGTLNQTTGSTANLRGLRLGNSSTVTGIYNLDGGTLNIGDLGIARGGTSTTHQFNLNGGTLRATADFAIGSDVPINVQSGGATINTNGFNINSSSALLAGTVAGGVITKTGTGQFNLPAGFNTMAGTINVNGGSFGGAGEFTAATVNVNSGGTLAGIVNVSNTTSGSGVLVASGGTISPGTNGGADNGVVTASAAAFTAGSKIQVSGASGDSLSVIGALTGNTVISVIPNGFLSAGPIDLVNYGTSSLIFTASLPHLTGATVVNNGSGAIQLNFTSQETLTWSGTGGAVWDATTNNTWKIGAAGVNFLQGDLVKFDDSSAVGSIAVQSAGVTPADVLFDNSATAYTLAGGGIGGGGALVKLGTATVILATNNSYSGTTTINAGGTLQIGNGGTSGTLGLGATTNDGTLSFNRSDSSLYLGSISGGGIVRSDGTGTTTLGGANSYSGGTVISKGILVGRTATSFGSGTITLNDASTGSANTGFSINAFNIDPAVTVANNIVVANQGTGTVSIGSSEQSNRLQGLIFTGTVTLGRDVTIYGEVDRTSFSGTTAAQTTPVITGFADKITIARSPNLDAGVVGRVTWDQNNSIAPLSTTPGAVTTIEIQEGAILQMGINVASIGAKDQIPDTATLNVLAGGVFQLGTVADGEVIGNLTGAGTVRSITNSGMLLTFGTATDATFSGVINGGNSILYRKVGTGTATWSGILDNPNGNIEVNGGTMVFAKDSTPFVHAVGATSIINTGGTLKLGGTYTDTRSTDNGRVIANTAPLNFPTNYVDQIYNNAQVTINTGGILDMNGKSEVITGFVGSGTGKVTNSVAGSTSILYVGRNNGDFTYTGTLEDGAGTLRFVKTGTGVQTLGGASPSFNGVTEILAGAITITNAGALGTTTGGTLLQGSRDGAATLNLTLPASVPATPNIVAEPFTMVSETAADQRAAIVNTVESSRLTGNIVVQGDGINQITASQAAGDQFQINSSITGTSNGTLFLRGNGEMQLNGTINAPDLQVAKTDPGLLILNSTGNAYFDISLVHGTVRTDVANAFDPTGVLRIGQDNNGNTVDLNGFNQTVAAVRLNNNINAQTRTITSVAPATFTVNTPTADGGNYNYGGLIAGAISLAKSGPGTQVLGGNNTYTGTTNVTGGALYVNGAQTLGGAYTVGSGAILGGEGSISTADTLGNVTYSAGSNLRVGNTTDAGGGDDLAFTLGAGTAFTLSASTTLSLDLWANLHLAGQIAGADQGESDVLSVTAPTINLAGILNVANPANISSWLAGDTFDLFDWFTTPTGTFNSVNLPTLGGGLTWDTSKLYLSEATDPDLAGTITVASSGGLTPIETWRQARFGSAANTGNGADGADPDKDGIVNVMEYGLDMNPNISSQVGLPTYSIPAGSGVISFGRNLAATDVAYIVQASSNLTTWTNLATRAAGSGSWSSVAPGAVVTDPGSGAVTVKDNVTVATEPRRFMRVIVSNPLP